MPTAAPVFGGGGKEPESKRQWRKDGGGLEAAQGFLVQTQKGEMKSKQKEVKGGKQNKIK